MQALGLIETRGLIAAIESADTMLKVAEVSLIDKTYVGGGLVSIAVTGGVAAVKASVEAGAAAVNQLNNTLLISQHVIPRPHEEIDEILTKPVKRAENHMEEKPKTKSIEEAVDVTKEDVKVLNSVIEEQVPESEVAKEISVTLMSEHPEGERASLDDLNATEINKSILDEIALKQGVEKAIERLSTLKVTKLRNLAREYNNLGLTGNRIAKADGKTLIAKFTSYFEEN